MNKFLSFYMKARCVKSFPVGVITTIMLIIILTSAAFSQETPNPAPTVTPTPNTAEFPGDATIAPPLDVPNYSNVPRPLPAQTPLAIEDAIRLALENNNDIEIAGSDVKSAEFDFTIARGAYIPVIVSETYYRRSTTPTASTLGGGANGLLTETSFLANAG